MGDTVVEQILSSQIDEPVDYDQDHDEWVVLGEGAAVLEVSGERMSLAPGDWVLLPRRTPHRLVSTTQGASWLAVRVSPRVSTSDQPPKASDRYLSTRFSTALMLAAELHAAQKRKKPDRDIPYVSHLLAVAALVLEDGGSEDEAIAGLLHDAVEDQGLTPERIELEFGPEVARIVTACSDAIAAPGARKDPWLPRKIAHVHHLADADASILRVTAADKLHNCLDVLADLEREGPQTLERFKGRAAGTCWYYGAMAQLLSRRLPASSLTPRLVEAAEALHAEVGLSFPAPQPEHL